MKPHFLLVLLCAASLVTAGEPNSANYAVTAEITDRGGRRTTSANYTHDGSAGLISGTSTTAAGTGVLKSGYVAQIAADGPAAVLEIVSVLSRKAHGAAGTFDIDLPLTGLAGIECRTGGAGGNYRVVVTFSTPVTVSDVSVTSIDGQAGGTQSVSGPEVTIDLSAVANAQILGIALSNVSNGSTAADIFVPMGVLVGDTNGSGAVTASDISQTKARSGQSVSASNFRSDVTASGGSINTSDIGLVKSKSGTQLP